MDGKNGINWKSRYIGAYKDIEDAVSARKSRGVFASGFPGMIPQKQVCIENIELNTGNDG